LRLIQVFHIPILLLLLRRQEQIQILLVKNDIPDYWNHTLYTTKTIMLSIGLSCLSTSVFKQQNQALAQQSIQTIKYRYLVIDLGNGLKTNAQLTYPAVGKAPFPGVLI
jgi:hypothetical protein